MPGQFLDSSRVLLDRAGVESALAGFIAKTLAWAGDEPDPRVARLRENWEAITGSDPEEMAFCNAAGRLGLDPYGAMEDGILALLERAGETPGEAPLFEDVLDAARRPAQSQALWDWAAGAAHSLSLGAAPTLDLPALSAACRPAEAGYRAARQWRAHLGLNPSEPVGDLSRLGEAMGMPKLAVEQRNHIPGGTVLAAVGWRAGSEPVLAGPMTGSEQGLRFSRLGGSFTPPTRAPAVRASSPMPTPGNSSVHAPLPPSCWFRRRPSRPGFGTSSDSDEFDCHVVDLSAHFKVSTFAVHHQFDNATRSS